MKKVCDEANVHHFTLFYLNLKWMILRSKHQYSKYKVEPISLFSYYRSNLILFSSDDGRDPVYTEDGEYESVTSSEDENGN